MITTSGSPLAMSFVDSSNNPLANGLLTLRLNTDAQLSGDQISAERIVNIPLDSSGAMSQNISRNDLMVPAGTVYFAKAYTAKGQLVWQQELSLTA
jgi:hypothetical protein